MRAIWLRGMVAPCLLALAAAASGLLWGAGAALAVVAGGALVIIAWHVHQLAQLARWARAPIDVPVPEGRGTWALAYAALYRRVRLRESRQRDTQLALDTFVRGAQALPEGVVVLDTGNRIQWANIRARQHFGLDLEHDLRAPIVNLVRHPLFVKYLIEGDYREPVVIASTRDSATTLSLQIVPFGVEEKLLMSRDVTQLEAVARMRRDFIANVSHELKTPLTVLAGFIETLTDVEFDERQRKRCLALMQEQATSMQRLVEDLLTLSALESDQNPMHEVAFATVPLLLELSAQAKALSGGKHEITLDIIDAADVIGGRDELSSAFANLISNAVRYTPEGGRIALEWKASDAGGEFSVADTGIGIAEEHVPRLTERFYRVDRSRSRATGGTGLGLAIVKHVLIRHQAELGIESHPGRGSRFTIRIPRQRVVPFAGAAISPADTAAKLSTNTSTQR